MVKYQYANHAFNEIDKFYCSDNNHLMIDRAMKKHSASKVIDRYIHCFVVNVMVLNYLKTVRFPLVSTGIVLTPYHRFSSCRRLSLG